MFKKSYRFSIIIALVCLLFLPPRCAAKAGGLTPRDPKLPKVTSVDQLMPMARHFVTVEGQLKKGEKVLIVSDRTVHPFIAEALQRAAIEAGAGKVDVIVLNGYPEVKTTVELIKMWADDWWPRWVWEAAAEADLLLYTCFINFVHVWHDGMPASRWFTRHRTREVKLRGTPETLAYEPHVNFPVELGRAIVKKVYEQIPKGRVTVRVTDPNGTDITFDTDYTPELERAAKENYQPSYQGLFHLTGRPTLFRNANGVIVAYSMHVGPIPRLELTVENSRITKVEGGGEVGEYMKEVFEGLKDINFGAHPGPGANWLEECSLQGHPKHVQYYDPGKLAFSSAFGAYIASRRSGAIHMAIGSGAALVENGEVRHKKIHIDLEFYQPTVWINGKKFVENGRLLALDDPEVRAVASKYGDPDELLREDWHPRLGEIYAK